MNRPTIYTVGDSHCWHAWLKVPNVVTRTVGPMLIHSFGKNQPIVTTDIPLDAIVCFSWGEIDCRCHVHKYQPWKETIDILVENYIKAIDINTLGRDPRRVWIYNVVPPIRNAWANPGFPFLGTDEERLSYVSYMNKKLSESKYVFIDLSREYSDHTGFMKPEIGDGHVHVSDESYLIKWIEENVDTVLTKPR